MISNKNNIFGLPHLGYGMGLRPQHYAEIMDKWPAVDWFEIISENFMDTGGRPVRMLEKIREKYPVVMHGVSLSIGTTDPHNSDYLEKLKALTTWLDPVWVSDHLCWTGVAHKQLHDLLPVPYTEESLAHMIARVKEVQDFLERPILLENPSTYMEFISSHMPEQEFLARLAEDSGCGLLLDANNVYVSCFNHRLNCREYIDALPLERVVQIHLAGHENHKTHIIDTHNDHVVNEVWDIYRYIIAQAGREISTMVEWDDDIPAFDVVWSEVKKAQNIAQNILQNNASQDVCKLADFSQKQITLENKTSDINHDQALKIIQKAILEGNEAIIEAEQWVLSKDGFLASEQLQAYINGYRYRLFDINSEEYPVLRVFLGDQVMDGLLQSYVESCPSEHFNVARHVEKFPQYITNFTAPDHASKDKWKFACEIAQLETDLSELFHALESEVLTTDSIAEIDPDIFLSKTLKLRTALRVRYYSYRVNDYYNQVMEGKDLKGPIKGGCWLVTWRHDDILYRLELEKEEYQILKAIGDGQSLGDALAFLSDAARVTEEDLGEQEGAEQKIMRWFSRWMENQLLAGVE